MVHMRLRTGVIIAFLAVTELSSEAQQPQRYQPPGRLIDIGGRKTAPPLRRHGKPSVILVAGGAYQRAHLDEVAGLVFSNSSDRVGMSVKDRAGLIWELTEDELRSAFPRPPGPKAPGPTQVGEPFNRLPTDLQAVRLWLAVRLWEESEEAKAGPESVLSWRKEFLRA
jgi:hypothetical protein